MWLWFIHWCACVLPLPSLSPQRRIYSVSVYRQLITPGRRGLASLQTLMYSSPWRTALFLATLYLIFCLFLPFSVLLYGRTATHWLNYYFERCHTVVSRIFFFHIPCAFCKKITFGLTLLMLREGFFRILHLHFSRICLWWL